MPWFARSEWRKRVTTQWRKSTEWIEKYARTKHYMDTENNNMSRQADWNWKLIVDEAKREQAALSLVMGLWS